MRVIEERRSIRKYLNKDINDDIILDLIESARLAPSGSNTQPWKFIIIRDVELKKKIAKVDHNQEWMMTAPVFIAALADLESRIKNSKDIYVDENSNIPDVKQMIRDTSIAIEHILLRAEGLGIGTCWTGWYDQKDMKEILNAPPNTYVVGIITLGYKDEEPKQRPRKSIEEILYYESWGNK